MNDIFAALVSRIILIAAAVLLTAYGLGVLTGWAAFG